MNTYVRAWSARISVITRISRKRTGLKKVVFILSFQSPARSGFYNTRQKGKTASLKTS